MAQLFTDEEIRSVLEDEFGTAAAVAGVPVTGVFQKGAAESGAIPVMGTQPVLVVLASSVGSATPGAAVTIGGDEYTLVRVEDDGQGVAFLVLEEGGPS